MIDDLAKSIQSYLSERLSSPLLGSFAVSWCAWNYKVLLFLLSQDSVLATIHLIDTVAFPDTTAILTRGILFPLLTSLLYVFGYPYPSRFAYEFTLRMQREIARIRQRIDGETPLTLQESRAIRVQIEELKDTHQAQIDRKDAQIERLTSMLRAQDPEAIETSLVNNVPKGQGRTPNSDSGVSIEELKILQIIEAYGGVATTGQIISEAGGNRTRTVFVLEELRGRDMLSPTSSGYALSQGGRKALLDKA